MTYSHFKKPDSYKNINTSTYKQTEPNTYLNTTNEWTGEAAAASNFTSS